MTNKKAIKWLTNLIEDIGKSEYGGLWHYKQALSEIKEILERNDWTPCSGGLPKKDGVYLITVDEGDRKGVSDDFFYFRADGTPSWYLPQNVVAWMPRPEPWGDERK